MRPANLLPSDLARDGRRQLPTQAIAAIGAGAAVGALIAGGYVLEHGKVTTREQELAAVQAQIAAVPRPKPVKTTISPELAAQKGARQAVFDQVMAGRTSWDAVLRELSLVLPGDVWLDSMSAKGAAPSADGTTPGTNPTLSLVGHTYSQEGVARLLSRLQVVPHFTNVQLQSSVGAAEEGRQIVNFTIMAAVVPAEGGS
ncbi:MAG: PilN domain-containing protein [Gaiellaceae bacterium]